MFTIEKSVVIYLKIQNSKGPITESCGKPQLMSARPVILLSCVIYCFRFLR